MVALRHSFLCLLTVFGTTACSNPASEAPVSLEPGLYAVSLGSFGAKAKEQLCFAASDVHNLDLMVRKFYYFTEDCSHKKGDRVGNAVSGQVRCEIAPTAGWDTTYTGKIAPQTLTIDAKMVNYVASDGSDSIKPEEVVTEGRYTATRVGDCG